METSFWKRHLPHYQIDGGFYFITFTTYQRRQLLENEKEIIWNAIHFLNGKKCTLIAAVVMNDHVHLILQTTESISGVLHSLKSFTAHQINLQRQESGKVWQGESYDRCLRSEEELLEKLKYIYKNSMEINTASQLEEYRWSYIQSMAKGAVRTGGTPVLLGGEDRRDACPTEGKGNE
jgi:REP element-mobilizing transposase RayT